MQARKPDTEQEQPAGPLGQPLDPPFRESPIAEKPAETAKKRRTWLFVPLAMLVIFGCFELVKYLSYSRTHVSTDNAFLAADITLVAPQVSGSVDKILVADNQQVYSGQLLLIL